MGSELLTAISQTGVVSRTTPRTPNPHSSPDRGAAASKARTSAREQLAAERLRAARRRRQLIVVIVPLAVVLVVVGALVGVRLWRGSPAPNAAAPAASSGADAVISAVTGVPAGVLDQIGSGSARPPAPIDAPPLTAEGKPKVLYVGAEYCPYCAAERWSTVVALSRFGTFNGLGQTASSPDDVFPSTPTLTFHGSTYTSSVVAFTGVETQGNEVAGGRYAPLDQLNPADQQTFETYNAPPYVPDAGSIPFIDIGGQFIVSGASYSPGVLKGKTHEQIAQALSDPNSAIAQGVDGAANLITAAVCRTTDGAPAAVCQAAGVQAAAKKLP